MQSPWEEHRRDGVVPGITPPCPPTRHVWFHTWCLLAFSQVLSWSSVEAVSQVVLFLEKGWIYRGTNKHKIIRGLFLFFFFSIFSCLLRRKTGQVINYRISLADWVRREICVYCKINKADSITTAWPSQLRIYMGTSPVVRLLRFHLPMQGMQIGFLVGEAKTPQDKGLLRLRAITAEPMRHNEIPCAATKIQHNQNKYFKI